MRWRLLPKEINTDEVPHRQQRRPDVAFSLNDEVVKQLEAWFYRRRRTDFPTTPTRGSMDRIRHRLEECGDELDTILKRATEIIEDRSRALPGPRLIPLPERRHPLWDRDLDG